MSASDRHIISIDPGTCGAVAVFNSAMDLLVVFDLPMTTQSRGGGKSSSELDTLALVNTLRPYATQGTMAVAETAIVKPPMKLTAARTIGINWKGIKDALLILSIGLREVAPSAWKAKLGLDTDKTKSLAMATQLYPAFSAVLQVRAKSADRAEAVLIGRAMAPGGIVS